MRLPALRAADQGGEELAFTGAQPLIVNTLLCPAFTDVFDPLTRRRVPDFGEGAPEGTFVVEDAVLVAGECEVERGVGGRWSADLIEVDEF